MSDFIVTASRNQVGCDLKGEAVILNLNSGKYYGLNAIGARVWALIQEPKTTSAIRDALVSEFDVDPAVCETDLAILLKSLSDAGLVEIQR